MGRFAEALLFALFDQPAHKPARENCRRGCDRQVRSHRECQRTNSQQLDRDHQKNAQQHQSPGELARKNSVNDRGHQASLRSCRTRAADTLDPLHLDLSGSGIVQVLSVAEHRRSQRVQKPVVFAGDHLFTLRPHDRHSLAREIAAFH